jgi:cell wall-associated NlpC family hydrolase
MKRKMLRIPAMFLFAFIITSCGTSKAKLAAEKQKAATSQRMARPAPPQTRINTAPSNALPEDNRVYKITTFAREFEGTPYKYGGTTREGMDCSGLVYTSFLQENIPLPRSSKDMAHLGERLSLVDVNIGDLLFFETNKNKKVINHVGLVVEIQPGHIFFIHSSSSRGVIISSLADTYWFDHFIMARRVI